MALYTPPPALVRLLRERAETTQQDFAELLGASQYNVSRWESGASRMPPELWAAVEPKLALGNRRSDERYVSYLFATQAISRGFEMTFLYDQRGRIGRVIGKDFGGWAQALATALEPY